MKPTKLMAVALCAAACVTTVAFAAEDSLVDSAATMSIADPVNPQPGMLFKGYNIRVDNVGDLPSKLTDNVPALTTTIVKSDQFSIDYADNTGVWEGFLKCKRSAKCTIHVQQNNGGAVLFVNGKKVALTDLSNYRTRVVSYVDMKAGFNHIKLFAYSLGSGSLTSVSLKDSESTKEPKPISPKDLFYDEKPDPGEVF